MLNAQGWAFRGPVSDAPLGRPVAPEKPDRYAYVDCTWPRAQAAHCCGRLAASGLKSDDRGSALTEAWAERQLIILTANVCAYLRQMRRDEWTVARIKERSAVLVAPGGTFVTAKPAAFGAANPR